jgi:hypothetical protein
LVLIAFGVFMAAGFVIGDRLSPAGKRLSKVTGVDPPAYFGVSHALLFHQNFDLADEYHHVPPDDSLWTAKRKETGHYGSAYAVGYSILAAPFLAAGTLVDALAGNPANGYSRFAILGYCLANIVLTTLGLLALFTLMLNVAEYWGIALRAASLLALFAAFAIFIGTSVGYYAFSPMPHAATFFCASLFLATWWKVRDRTDVPSWALLGLIGGLLSVTRWQDIFFLAGPILVDLFSGAELLIPRIRSRIAYGAVAILCWTPQILEWKYIYGKYLTVPQGNGFFVFPPPFIPKVLFSTQNGWITWTPLVLLGLCGLIWGAFKKFRLFLPWILVIALEVSLIGSLPLTWWGGEGFSGRYLTASASMIGLGLATLLCLTAGKARVFVLSVGTTCCLFALVFAIQFRLYLVPHSDRLTASEYFTDKFRLLNVRRRKMAVQQAERYLQEGSPSAAVATLESAQAYGPDRDVLAELSKAYRAGGQESEAQNAERRLMILLQSRLF